VRGNLRLQGGIVAAGVGADEPRLCGVVLQVAESVANYGINPTRLAPQAAAAVRAVEQGFGCEWLGRRRRAGYACPFGGRITWIASLPVSAFPR
jgi:hypothetical protein